MTLWIAGREHDIAVPHPGGLDLHSAFESLEVLLASPRLAAIAITELNPERDLDHACTRRLVDGLVEALSTGQERAA